MSSEIRVFDVPSISCAHCAGTIETSLGALAGITSVVVDVEAKQVRVLGDLSDEAIATELDELGYAVVAGA